jgi:hypothetical protein
MSKILCSKCLRPPIIFQPYSGMHLCREHFILDLESKVKKTIRENKWLNRGDHLGVILDRKTSGYALLHLLSKITQKRPDISLIAIRTEFPENWYFLPGQIESLFHARFILLHYNNEDDTEGEITGDLCTLAEELHLSRVLSGSTLDDVSDQNLYLLLSGKAGVIGDEGGEIEPFRKIPQTEIELYASCIPGMVQNPREKADTPSLMRDIHTALEDYADLHPSVRYSILGFHDNLKSLQERRFLSHE